MSIIVNIVNGNNSIRLVCRECLEKNKDTFDIEVGDCAKIRFGRDSPGEYMWVKVISINGDKIEGTLGNNPEIIEEVQCGDKVTFWHGDVCARIRKR